MRWHYLLIDNDNTLMDFSLGELRALHETFQHFGLDDTQDTMDAYLRVNNAKWRAHERGEITLEELSRTRMDEFLREISRTDLPSEAVRDYYETALSRHAELLPGAVELLETVRKAGMKIAVVSNGISSISRPRIENGGFYHLLDACVISQEVGAAKPDPEMLRIALKLLGCTDPKDAVVVGDSLTSDVAAANAAGIECIRLGAPTGLADFSAETIPEVMRILLED